jgi:hypothetical protein
MEGYDVLTPDEEKVGRVVGTIGDNLIVEQGHLRKSKHALPKTFAHVDDDEQVVRVTVSKQILGDAPTVQDDELDEQAVARHYGLAAGESAPETQGYGDVEPDDPAWSAEHEELRTGVTPAPQERAQIREGLSSGGALDEGPESPGLLGERHNWGR